MYKGFRVIKPAAGYPPRCSTGAGGKRSPAEGRAPEGFALVARYTIRRALLP